MQGDFIKNIDWKAYAKTDRYYVKRYEEETNLICNLILDISKSMDFKHSGNITKLEYGKILAASISYLLIGQNDAAGLALYSDKIEDYLIPKSTRLHVASILKSLSTHSSSGTTNTAASLNKIAEKIKRRGLVIIISDLFDDSSKVLQALKHFRYKGNEVIVFQILDKVEMEFSFGKDAIFVDKETEEEMTTMPFQVQKAYNSAFSEFLRTIKSECVNHNIDYNLIDTTTPFDKAILNFFKKRSHLN